MGEYEGLIIAEKIVEEEAEKYNNGWIPCSERMPVEHDSIFAKFKGTEKWKKAMFEKASSVVNVTVVDEKGNVTKTKASTIDGKWSCDLLRFNKKYQIIAWQPLPEPYQPERVKAYKKKTNFDRCCESMEAMAQIIDIAKTGWTKDQIMEWLQSEAEE